MIYFVLISIICSTLLVGALYKEISLLKAITLGIADYFFSYILVSGLLLWVEWYSVKKAAVGSLFVLAFVSAISLLRTKRLPKYCFVPKEWLILLLILAILPATIEKFEFFGMGQDEGVYQTKAIELIYGNDDRIRSFDEFQLLETEEQRESYTQTIQTLLGYYLLEQEDPYSKVEGLSEIAGIYHGIPTWPSVLALFGEMFGISHMQDCQTLFFIIFLLIAFFFFENLGIKTIIEVPALLMLGLSPQVLWVSKSALTEMFLSVIIACFLLLLTETNGMHRFSWIPVVAFSFFHATVYTVLPLILLIYWGLFLMSKEKMYIYASNISVCGYFVGFLFMVYTSAVYTNYNYVEPLSRLMPINNAALPYVICISVAAALLITNLLPVLIKSEKIRAMGTRLYEKRHILFRILIVSLLCIFAIKCVKSGVTADEVGNLALVSYAFATGIILLPATILMMLFLSKTKMIGRQTFILLSTFIYGIFVYGIFLRFTCAHYFYYGRYLVPYCVVIAAAFCYLLSGCERYYLGLLCFLGMAGFVEPDMLLVTEPDDTRMTWEILEDAMALAADRKPAMIVEEKYAVELFLPLKIAGAAVFDSWDDPRAQIDFLSPHYSDIYFVGTEKLGIDDSAAVYRNEFLYSEYDWSRIQNISEYPLGLDQRLESISVYKYNRERLEYLISGEEFEGSGFDFVEGGGYSWTKKEKASVSCYLDRDDYRVIVTQGPGILLWELGLEEYPIKVSVNGEYLTTLIINYDNNGKDMVFDLPKDLLKGRRNIISFESQLWNPAECGLEDNRKIGFSFIKMEFLPIEK